MSILDHPTSESAFDPAADSRLPKVQVAGNDLTLFDGATTLVAAMIEDIRAAHSRIWLESYTIADDAAGRAIAAALLERAAAGVDVRVMYDAIGSLTTPQAFFDRLAAGGVEVHTFHSIRDNLLRFGFFRILNRRNHRKLLVVDDRVAYFGGMNIVDQRGIVTPSDAKLRNLPASAGWRDLHLRLVGPKQGVIAEEFERLWNWKHLRRRDRRTNWQIGRMLAVSDDAIHFFASRPGRRMRRVARILGPLIRRARRNITLSMAYFIPVGRVLRELLRARRRGVQVRVVVPAESDVKAVHWATRHLCQRLLARGIQIYERQDFMLHSKVMVIDELWTVVGSCNLDPRSLRLNLEFLAVVRSRAMAAAATAFCRHEMSHSRRIRLAEIRSRPLWQRVRDRLAWSVRRWL
ncbi:MAG TPA: phospholipase D-like domain-containing protein [Pirellulales bacterium]|jgi:cardiolipin synthase|nr:phospholipase D-like domain-containing protein [Pirellulales bacterium]